jgi:hypothetical protein
VLFRVDRKVHVAHALHELTADMDVYKGVRLAQLLEAVYQQGKKDGALDVRDSFEGMMKGILHLNPASRRKKQTVTATEGKKPELQG